MKSRMIGLVCLSLALALGLIVPAQASDDWAQLASGELFTLQLAAGVLWDELGGTDAPDGTALRALDTLAVTYITVNGLKELTSRPRPDAAFSGKDDSFPSGHAAASFAVAALRAEFDPDSAPYWYGAAALISASRVELDRHRVGDVLAGAALGWGLAQLELASEDGLLIAPFVDPSGDGMGVQLSLDL